MTSLLRRLGAAATIVVVTSAALAGVASAHASLLATTPADTQSVAADPGTVSATFSEQVSVEVGGLSVRNDDGDRVDQGASTLDAAASTVSVNLQPDLPDGTYIVTYRVLSADGHPVSGSWVFGIGASPVDASAGSSTHDGVWELVGAIARFVAYLGALLAAGMAFFLALIHDRRPDSVTLTRVVQIAAPLTLVGVIGTVVAQAALLTGEGLGASTDLDVLRSVLSDRLGWASALLLLGLAAVDLSIEMRNRTATQVVAVVGGLVVTGSFALWGHDTEAPHRWLTIGSDIVHVTAAAVWLGGLVGLAVVLARRAPRPVTSTVEMVGRFSTAAAVSVAALIGAGLALTWVELGSLRGLWDTTYGRLVLVKAAITAGVVVLAALNRFRLLPAIEAGAFDAVEPDAAAEAGDEAAEQAARWSRLRRLVAVEALALVAVLGVTAVLVNTTPSRTALGVSGGAVSLTQDIPNGTVNLEVAPAKSGPNTMHIQYRDSAGAPIDLATTLTVELSLPSEDLGPIQRQIVKLAPGHFVLEGNEMSVPGEWTVTLAARTSDFTEQRNTFQVLVTR